MFLLLALSLVLAASPADAKPRTTCDPGRFLVIGQPITTGPSQTGARAVVIAKPVSLPGLCETAAKTKLRAGKKVTRVTATWRRCAGLRGHVRFAGKIVDQCARLVGTLRARKYKRRVEATRSRCGDDVVDADASEQCEPPDTAGCDTHCRFTGAPGAPPRVMLRATPPAGVAPFNVTLDAIAEDPEGNPLTYHWTFGDGEEADGGPTVVHTYAQPGTYRCVVAVSDGFNQTTAAVLIDAGSAGTTMSVGPAGGDVVLGRLRVSIPAGLLPQGVDVSILELPTLEGVAPLDAARFRAIGPAYRVDVPVRAGDPFDLVLSWLDAEVPAGFAAANLGVMWRVEPLVEEPVPDQLAVALVPTAAAVDLAGHTLQADIGGSVVVQAVAMAGPILTAGTAAARPMAGPQAAPPPLVIVSFDDPPPDPTAYGDAVRAAVAAAFDTLIVQRGFPAPGKHLTVVTTLGISVNAGVSKTMPQVILINPSRVPLSDVGATIAHEYFHVIELWSSNAESANDVNRWFLEGTAEWARDEVFDAIPGNYDAPAGVRFEKPLNQPVGVGDDSAYQTVAFWKWLESTAPGMIAAIVADHRTRTRILVSPTVDILNTVDAAYLDGLLALDPAIEFLDFATAALWRKDFDVNETGAGDLWDPAKLGRSRQVPTDLLQVIELKRGEPGESESNPMDVPYLLSAHLTATTQRFVNLDGSLTGTLHLRFPARTDHRVGVAVVAYSPREVLLYDLSVERSVEMELSPGEPVVVIETDDDWLSASGAPHANTFDAWVEPCGGPTNGIVADVVTASGLRPALLAAQPGDTVRLAAGVYQLPVSEWPFWHDGTLSGVAMVPPGVTLAGAGAGTTTVYAAGDGSSIYLKDRTTLRDLTIEFVGSGQRIWISGAEDADAVTRQVWLCGVTARFHHHHPFPLAEFSGVDFEPYYDGTYTFDMHGSTIDCADSTMHGTGVEIWPSGASKPPNITVTARIGSSTIRGCEYGLYYQDSPGERVEADFSCLEFRENSIDNVIRCDCTSSPCECVEMCAP